TGGVNFTQNKIILKEAVKQGTEIINPEVAITWGVFIQSIVDFLIIAFCIFMAIRFMNKIKNATRKAEEEAAAEEVEPTEDQKLLMEIRDLLKTQVSGKNKD
ncbi:MscL family protein, partial [uncultured Alistipes sp.]|uniref:MscL family protein n=1 Tax=uncultured Alistipes sp. TaxID=538949 RepID=UPI002607AA69